MLSEVTKILEFNQHQKSDKSTSIVYADLRFLIKIIDGCESNFETSSTTKVGEHILCGYSISTIWAFLVQKISMAYTQVNIS